MNAKYVRVGTSYIKQRKGIEFSNNPNPGDREVREPFGGSQRYRKRTGGDQEQTGSRKERDVPRGVRGVKARQKGETASRRGCEPEKAAKTRGQPPVPLIGPIDYKP